jgi:uncharacterized membrane protein YbhN (UPF0104 family)
VIAALLTWFLYAARNAKVGDVAEARAHATTWWGRFKAYLTGFGVAARSLASGPRFLGALLLSMGSWITQVLTFEYAAAAAHVQMPAAASLAALLAVNLGLLIRATPGNVGFFQFVFALAAEPFGVARNDAIAVSLLIQTLQIIPTTMLGVALAPEFIFRRGERKRAVAVAKEMEPAVLGSLPQEGEKLGGAPGQP